jgi:hypothetical protein
MYAAMGDKLEIVKELLARSADINAKDKKGFTVLEMDGGRRVRPVLIRYQRSLLVRPSAMWYRRRVCRCNAHAALLHHELRS